MLHSFPLALSATLKSIGYIGYLNVITIVLAIFGITLGVTIGKSLESKYNKLVAATITLLTIAIWMVNISEHAPSGTYSNDAVIDFLEYIRNFSIRTLKEAIAIGLALTTLSLLLTPIIMSANRKIGGQPAL